MSQQIPLWFESYEDAIRATIQSLGGFDVVAKLLRPAMPADQAKRWLHDTLNHNKRDKLDIHDLALIRKEARRRGIDVLAAYEAREAGYAEPQPLVIEDEAARLQREFVEAVRALKSIEHRMDQLTVLRAVA
jgi:hypothetical protein